jgi:hypothetical protein
MIKPRVFNKMRPHPPRAVLVDRTTDFGNPFVIGKHGNRKVLLTSMTSGSGCPSR